MSKPSSRNRRMLAALFIIVVGSALAISPAQAGTRDFSESVRQVEIHYRTRRNLRFLMGFAGFAASVWRPCGVKHVKIAIFESPRVLDRSSGEDFVKVVRASLSSDWQTFVQTYSRKDGEKTWIFAKAPASSKSRRVTLLIATQDADDAVMIQASVDMRRWDSRMTAGNRHQRGGNSLAGGILQIRDTSN